VAARSDASLGAVALERVPTEERAALRSMLDAYLISHADLVDPGRAYGDPTVYAYFDLYWVEPDRRPYWIVADGERAGFVLVNAYSPSGLGTTQSIAEFCVTAHHRRRGLGAAAALAAFRRHPGQWELQVYRANLAGMAFWPRAIGAAAPSAWDRIEREDRVIHRFEVR
jgi:predicted acetyltransferase